MRPQAAAASAAAHIAAVFLIFSIEAASRLMKPARLDRAPPDRITLLAAWTPRTPSPGGGGQRDPLPASKGRLPPPPSGRVFVPPTARPPNDAPRLPVEQAIVIDPDLALPTTHTGPIGDPFGRDGPLSGGRGGPMGIGDGECCGVGPGNGNGFGVPGPPPPPVKAVRPRHFTLPVLLTKVEPEYSEEARKARVQGVVLLRADVQPSGAAANIRVVRPLGLGLDERAVQAATLWRFRPAMADGRPVEFTVTIEVNFRLL